MAELSHLYFSGVRLDQFRSMGYKYVCATELHVFSTTTQHPIGKWRDIEMIRCLWERIAEWERRMSVEESAWIQVISLLCDEPNGLSGSVKIQ